MFSDNPNFCFLCFAEVTKFHLRRGTVLTHACCGPGPVSSVLRLQWRVVLWWTNVPVCSLLYCNTAVANITVNLWVFFDARLLSKRQSKCILVFRDRSFSGKKTYVSLLIVASLTTTTTQKCLSN